MYYGAKGHSIYYSSDYTCCRGILPDYMAFTHNNYTDISLPHLFVFEGLFPKGLLELGTIKRGPKRILFLF